MVLLKKLRAKASWNMGGFASAATTTVDNENLLVNTRAKKENADPKVEET